MVEIPGKEVCNIVGGMISPLLSNIYLHAVLDQWFEEQVKPRMKGKVYLVRFADDAVLIFSERGDAQCVTEVLPKKFGRYRLTVHPEKTRIVRFTRPKDREAGKQGRRPQTFNFLGFTHYWGLSRKGSWIVKRKTEKKRVSRALKAVAQWCRRNRHVPVRDQQRLLKQKLYGHYSYYGITGNAPILNRFHHEVHRVWRKWLNRRMRGNPMPWDKFNRLLNTYPLPAPRVVHSVCTAKPMTQRNRMRENCTYGSVGVPGG